uniref:Uncharacterized protein n=1 Tax=Haptolina brevifila TaxID=156173 RepID=A0A7S2C3L8_9EUKA
MKTELQHTCDRTQSVSIPHWWACQQRCSPAPAPPALVCTASCLARGTQRGLPSRLHGTRRHQLPSLEPGIACAHSHGLAIREHLLSMMMQAKGNKQKQRGIAWSRWWSGKMIVGQSRVCNLSSMRCSLPPACPTAY